MMWLVSLIGKCLVFLSRRLGSGHGSALPGLVVEKLSPHFLGRLLAKLPEGVVLVSGTNGKTTTTKIVADLLRADGYRVFTNPSGSNFARGVISAALPVMRRGRLEADIAVLELDEAHATHFVAQVKPRYSLLLNVLRDQLDRFGEIDQTARLLSYVAEQTTDVVVLNADDPRLSQLGQSDRLTARPAWFGAGGEASQLYCTDEDLHTSQRAKRPKGAAENVLTLDRLTDRRAQYLIDGKRYVTELRLFGVYNALNCGAALSLVRAVEQDRFDPRRAVETLAKIKPAFGRGEELSLAKGTVRLILVKNPSGFQLSLDSAEVQPTLIAINDRYADGRDVSWLWDVKVDSLRQDEVSVTGIRAYDMALRLEYDQVALRSVEPDIVVATRSFLDQLEGDGQVFATYTAMLKIRQLLLARQSREEKR